MDGRRFDRLTVQLERMVSRRRAGAVLAALGLGIGFGPGEDAEAGRKKKKGKKTKKPGNGGPAPTCSGAPPCAAGCRDCGTVCIAEGDAACCDQNDCGGFQNAGDIVCGNQSVCICNPDGKAGWGICSRNDQGGGLCGPCCDGADACPGERVCLSEALCGCQDPLSACPQDFTCRLIESDRDACGAECRVCFDGGSCCDGECVALRGCAPGTGSSSLCNNVLCGSCNTLCTGNNRFCCNQGAGMPGACVDAVNGLCPSPPF